MYLFSHCFHCRYSKKSLGLYSRPIDMHYRPHSRQDPIIPAGSWNYKIPEFGKPVRDCNHLGHWPETQILCPLVMDPGKDYLIMWAITDILAYVLHYRQFAVKTQQRWGGNSERPPPPKRRNSMADNIIFISQSQALASNIWHWSQPSRIWPSPLPFCRLAAPSS